MANFGLSVAGEFSNAVTDCGLWLNGVDLGTRYEGTYIDSPERIGDCAIWTDWTKYDDKMKADIKNFALASMDALQVVIESQLMWYILTDNSGLLFLDVEDRKL